MLEISGIFLSGSGECLVGRWYDRSFVARIRISGNMREWILKVKERTYGRGSGLVISFRWTMKHGQGHVDCSM